MSQNPDFEETSLFDLFPAEEKKTDKKEQKNEKTEDAASKDGRGKESAVTAVKTIKLETAPRKEKITGSAAARPSRFSNTRMDGKILGV